MFKNKAFQVKVVNANSTAVDADEKSARIRLTPEQITKIAQENVKYVALIVGAGYAVKKVLDTSSEAALIITRSKF